MYIQRRCACLFYQYLFYRHWLLLSLMTIVLGALSVTAYAEDTFIAGVVFLDTNENGVLDANEPTKVGHDIYLNDLTLQQQGKSSHFHTRTNQNGEFYFLIDNIGNYEIETDLDDLVLVTPAYAEIAMSPYNVAVTEKGQTLGC